MFAAKVGSAAENATCYWAVTFYFNLTHGIRAKIANPEDVFEDLGRVSAALLNAMKIEPGDFVRA